MDMENLIGINRILYLVYSGTDEEILLEADSISNVKDYLLYYAVEARRGSVVRELLNKHCNPNTFHDMYYPMHLISKPQNVLTTLMFMDINDNHMKLIKKYIIVTKKMNLPKSTNKAVLKEILKGKKFLSSDYLKVLADEIHEEELLITKYLIDSGADINSRDAYGCTAFHYATHYKNIDMINLLLSYNVDTSIKSYDGYSVFYYAVTSKDTELAKNMIKYYDYTYDNVLLTTAVTDNNYNMLLTLLEMGLDVNSVCNSGKTPLHSACTTRIVEIVETLLSHGANINARCNNYRTPLHDFTAVSEYKMVKLLIDNGADIHVKDNDGKTPLHNAAANYIEDGIHTVEMLLMNGADVTAKDREGNTPLHNVHRSKNSSIIADMLIEYGADVKATNIYNSTALHNAYSSYKLVEVLLQHGADPNIVNNFCSTPLESMIHFNTMTSVKHVIIYIVLSYYRKDKIDDNVGLVKNIRLIEDNPILLAFKVICEKELETIRSIHLTYNYSLDIFLNSKNLDNTTWLSYSTAITELDISSFTIYGKILKYNINKSKHRATLLHDSIRFLNDSLSNTKWYSLPNEIKYHILSFLDNKDLYLIKL
ncbi:CNPV291 ankyrin repeat protein [Canarypox virus]|uniref:CNPV291 ankyrin repeat protein n=1 Tax=Canarypox virus TaxID=44088 RepID=Q6VZ56_CNPV|nr:CNPV291 ankyrin repeat protein [Canarypox virus]AAR83637.1 CNPV291 ankyrin repeat protein [Canarypox virus]AWD84767.1 ankyrin repeat protein [Canarypox virus]